MQICFLSSMHPPTDKRVFDKEACSLADAGFDVVHLAPAHGGESGEHESNGVRIITYPPFQGLKGRLFGLPRLYRLARAVDAQAYHCNEVDSWMVGVALRIFSGRLCIFDVHEHYPEEFTEVRISPWARPFVKTSIVMFMRFLSRFTNRIVLAKKSLEQDFNYMPANSVRLVQNFVPIKALPKPGQAIRSDSDPLKMSHLGLLNKYRGWPQLIEAMSIAEHQNTELLVLGDINDGSEEEFIDTIRSLGLENRVRYEKWLPFDQAMLHVKESDVGVICFQPGLYNHVHALPHKLFDYMGAELAIVAPDFAIEVANIVKDAQCGILIDSSSPIDIAGSIDFLSSNRETLREMGRRGHQAVLGKYNWENEAEKLVSMYRELEQE